LEKPPEQGKENIQYTRQAEANNGIDCFLLCGVFCAVQPLATNAYERVERAKQSIVNLV
jgi:hypothetical protein